ncbi:unnamed protein product [Leptosia nina]|uniref:Uncharacterized protein n=1 Tax=Leptosia nina TaxID=320188 RepID=A0AAV1K3F9_9NEOP
MPISGRLRVAESAILWAVDTQRNANVRYTILAFRKKEMALNYAAENNVMLPILVIMANLEAVIGKFRRSTLEQCGGLNALNWFETIVNIKLRVK